MKSLFKKLGILLLAGMGITACQKEFTIEEGLDPVDPPTATGTYLDKMYVVDSTGGAGNNDTVTILTYFYDAQKRVTLITDSTLEGNSWVLFKSNRYQYNGTDTLPYRSVDYDFEKAIAYNDPAALDSIVYYHEYDAAGRNKYDSTIYYILQNDVPPYEYYSSIAVKKYQYSGNNIYGDSRQVETGTGVIYLGRDTAITDGNGNITLSKKYEIIAGVSTLQTTSSFTYDTKINPFSRLSNFRTLRVFPFGETFIEELQAKNNRLKAHEVSVINGFTFDEDLTGKYTYNSNNYPVIIADEYIPYPGEFYKAIFTYKSL